MPKTIDIPMLLGEGDNVVVTLWKRDFRNALHLVSKLCLFKPDEILLSALEFPAVWTVECALWNRSYIDTAVGFDGEDVKDAFTRITKAKNECHAQARRIVRRELKRHAESKHYEPSSDFGLERYTSMQSVRELVLLDEMGRISANVVIPGFKWRHFVKACLESGVILTPGAETIIELCLPDIARGVSGALVFRDYGKLMEKAMAEDAAMWLKLRNEISAVSKQRFLS